MSMSSLEAQLAALHSQSSENPGSILPTSKRNSDIIGRGLLHSAQRGHAVKKSRFKPSVLYPDARAAADVPLSTLQGNAFSAMQQLFLIDADFEMYFKLVDEHSIQSERGLITKKENELLNLSMRDLLRLVGSVLNESSSRSQTSTYYNSLHLMEYLLRRYEVHLYNPHDLLVAFLPHHEDPLFMRILQLVDLPNVTTFTFLRPYASPSRTNPTRSIFAKQASKDTALLKIICQTAQHLRTKQNNHRGAPLIISFCCAVVVECLTLQARANPTGKTLNEPTVRIILPYCHNACSWKQGGDWRAFGYVVLSTLTELAELAMPTIEKLSHSIVSGGVDIDALTLLYTILPKKPVATLETENDAIIPGVDLPESTFLQLVQVESIQTLIGEWNQQYNVLRFIVTLLDMAMKHKRFQFLCTLLSTPTLENVCKESSLITAVAATIVNFVALQTIEPDHPELASLLRALKKMAPGPFDKGIARMVMQYRKSDQSTRQRIAAALGVFLGINQTDECSLVLPPRVALEHSEASVRTEAMRQLVEQNKKEPDSSLLSALLRHFVMEDDEEMKLAAASAVDNLQANTQALAFDKSACNLIIQAIISNSSIGANRNNNYNRAKAASNAVLELGLKFAGSALQSMVDSECNNEIDTLVLLLVAHCCDLCSGTLNTADDLSMISGKALCMAWAHAKSDVSNARRIIATHPRIIASIENKVVQSPFRRKAIANILMAIAMERKNKKASVKNLLHSSVWKVIAAWVELLSDDPMEIHDDSSCLVQCVELACEKAFPVDIIRLISSFSQIPSDVSFHAISAPVMKAIASSLKISLISIVLEMANRPTLSTPFVVRLLRLGKVTLRDEEDGTTCFVPMIALLCHADYEVRKIAQEMITDIQARSQASTRTPLFRPLTNEQSTLILMDGSLMALSSFFRFAVVDKEKSSFPSLLLSQCAELVTNCSWLPLDQAVGNMRATAVALSAAELAGESLFPLVERWSLAGSKILESLINKSSTDENKIVKIALIDAVIRMLKAVRVNDPSELSPVLISSGPNGRGTRARSYSVGRQNGISFLDDYPRDMFQALTNCLNITENSGGMAIEICRTAIREILSSESWCEAVFKKFTKSQRIAVTIALLNTLPTQMFDIAENSILHLPLEATDISELFQTNGSDLSTLAILMDHVRLNASSLGKSKAVLSIVSSLFQILHDISSKLEDDDGAISFAQISTLKTLTSLFEIEDAASLMAKQKDLVSHTTLLVNLMGNSKDRPIASLTSWKARKIALKLMSRLCSFRPAVVVKGVLEGVLQCINTEQINSMDSVESTLSSIRGILVTTVPVVHEFCDSAEISIHEMLNSLLHEVDKLENDDHVHHIMTSILDALATTGEAESVTSFFCILLARSIKYGKKTQTEFINLVTNLNQPLLSTFLVRFCSFTNTFLLHVADTKSQEQSKAIRFCRGFLLSCHSSTSKELALRYCGDLCKMVLQTSSLQSMEDFLQKSNDSNLSLQLLQELLHLQSTFAQVDACMGTITDDVVAGKNVLESCVESIEESLSVIQHSLPIPVFLASTSSIIEDHESGHLRTRALRFLAKRSSGVCSNTPEAILFLDLLPMVVPLLSDNDGDKLLHQSAALVVEQFARALCFSTVVSPQHIQLLLEALTSFTSSLLLLCQDEDRNTGVATQLICTLALSSSTLVRALKARCLPTIPKLFDSLLSLLSESTLQPGDSNFGHNNVLLLSLLRTLSVLIEELPQFLVHHLDKLLSPSLLSSYQIEDIDLLVLLAERVPPRQLLPAATRALTKCTVTLEFMSLLKMIKNCVVRTARGEIGCIQGYVVKSVLFCCDKERTLFPIIHDVLVSLVMKLSEKQLRPLYAQLRAWRGDDPCRRLAFWSLSCALSQNLKSIFLPYLSTVVSDALHDLEIAVSILCSSRKASKKAKMIATLEQMNYLPALVSCLGNGFASDSRDGGDWIRDEKEGRFELFREPLCALLFARVPKDFPFESDPLISPYHELIVKDGGVISCIVSLASAAGSDTLWKPLNHAVLTACANEEHIEIQRAGLVGLLKLMQTLGEEYMVLLPECLPVLAELLEADEETAAIARECVDLAEDFLGESLEDSLR